MNQARQNIEASRMRRRIEQMIERDGDLKRDVNEIRRDRNQSAAYQVRSIAGNIGGAIFGQANVSNNNENTVGM
jgi:hypothetical protein